MTETNRGIPSHPRRIKGNKTTMTSLSRLYKKIGIRLNRRDGVALLMVIFIITALTALVVTFMDTTQRHLHLTQYYKNNLQAYWTAQSGIQAASAVLQADAQLEPDFDGYNSAWNCESSYYKETVAAFAAMPLCGTSFMQEALTLAAKDPLAEEQAPRKSCFIVDENRKLSLFTLVDNYGQQKEETKPDLFQRLVFLLMFLLSEKDLLPPDDQLGGATLLQDEGPGQPISESQAEALALYVVDWIDTPNNTSTDWNADRGEETCPEDGLPYTTKNGLFDSTDEIALVCGFRQMKRHVIEELARNLTVYRLETNVNTATLPVLNAFLAQLSDTGDPVFPESEEVYDWLHPTEEQVPVDDHVIQNDSDYTDILRNFISDPNLPTQLAAQTGTRSNYFRVGISGLVINPETGTVEANARVIMVMTPLQPDQGIGFDPVYYREG